MKKKITLFIILLFAIHVKSQNWQLIWEDNFDGNNIDATKWVHDYGTGSQFGMWGWGNGELQYYQPQNTTVNNGIATIEVREEPAGLIDSWNNTSYYSSSKITTRGLFDFRYGKVEARIKTLDGQGFWPAFWLLPTGGSWPCDGEIDIMEQWGNNYLTNSTTGAAHIGSCPYSQSTHFYQNFSSYISNGSYADEFHTYSIIWKEDTITWFVDDEEMFQITPSSYFSIPSQHNWPFNSNNWFIMINLAITQTGPNANTVFPNNIQIDYVKVYQENSTSVNQYTSISPFDFSDNILTFDNNKFKSIKLLDINGKYLSVNSENNKVNTKALSRGIYIIQSIDMDGISSYHKIVIN